MIEMDWDFLEGAKNWYDEADYRLLFAISLIMLLVFSGFLYINRQKTGEWLKKGIDLEGGKKLSISTTELSGNIDAMKLKKELRDLGIQSNVEKTESLTGPGGTLIVKVSMEADENTVREELEGLGIDTSGNQFESASPTVAKSLLQQSKTALMVAFMFMAIAVFIVYRDFAPSFAIVLAAFTDIICTLSIMQIFGIELTQASFAGLLLVLGYSIDSDIVLTTRVLKRRKGSVSERTFSAMKTSLTMTITTLSALAVLYLVAVGQTATQALQDVAIVLIIALVVDLVATWFGNASILRWWVER